MQNERNHSISCFPRTLGDYEYRAHRLQRVSSLSGPTRCSELPVYRAISPDGGAFIPCGLVAANVLDDDDDAMEREKGRIDGVAEAEACFERRVSQHATTDGPRTAVPAWEAARLSRESLSPFDPCLPDSLLSFFAQLNTATAAAAAAAGVMGVLASWEP